MDPAGMRAGIVEERVGSVASDQRWEPGMMVVAPLVVVKGERATMVPCKNGVRYFLAYLANLLATEED